MYEKLVEKRGGGGGVYEELVEKRGEGEGCMKNW